MPKKTKMKCSKCGEPIEKTKSGGWRICRKCLNRRTRTTRRRWDSAAERAFWFWAEKKANGERVD